MLHADPATQPVARVQPSRSPPNDKRRVDRQTIEAYDHFSAEFADEWLAQPPPEDLYELLSSYFRPGRTADIGCGAGRDCAWLEQNGYPVTGYDASDGLLLEARRRYPELSFARATLPGLEEITENFANILCETVIMHLPRSAVRPAVQRLVELLEPDGTLYLSWRVTADADRRDDRDRLYCAFDASAVLEELASLAVLFEEEATSRSSGRTIHRLVARKATV